MGCVSYSLRFFPDGKITRGAMRRAELAARSEVQAIAAEFSGTTGRMHSAHPVLPAHWVKS